MLNCLIVGFGGFIGAVCRYLIGLIPLKSGTLFPLKTFAINIIGAFAIGLLAAVASRHQLTDSRLILMLKVGVCGGFTTFSTFALETTDLVQKGHSGIALAYVLSSVIFGTLAAFASQLLIR